MLPEWKNNCIIFQRRIEMAYLGLLVPLMALSIPIIAIGFSHKEKNQKNKIREIELKKEF
jgi:hypothetical protein